MIDWINNLLIKLKLKHKPKRYEVTLKAKGMMGNLYPVKTVTITVLRKHEKLWGAGAVSRVAGLQLTKEEIDRHYKCRKDGSCTFWLDWRKL